MRIFLVFGLITAITGCATTSSDIQATYVSPLIYNDYDCDQIAAESGRINRRAAEMTGQIDKRARDDKTQATVGLILFWPTLFFLGGNDEQNAELARLKGESEALEITAIEKKCGYVSEPVDEMPEAESTEAESNEAESNEAESNEAESNEAEV